MARFLIRTAFTATPLLLMAGLVLSSDEATSHKPSSETTAALVAPEFSKYLDVDAAAAALRADDAETLLAIADKLGTAEHATGKINLPLPAMSLYRAAINVAQQKHDIRQFDKLDQIIGVAKHLSKEDQQTLLAEVRTARKLVAGNRKIDAGPGLKPSEVTAEAIALYNTFVREIRITQEYGTEEELTQLVDGIRQLRELHPKQREHLAKMARTASVAIRERGIAEGEIPQLVAVSRSVNSGLRILGPGEAPINGTVSLVVLPTGPASTAPGQIHFRASAGVEVAEQLVWSGKPLIVPVTIKSSAGRRVFVTAGTTAKANSMTWNAQTARE